MAIRLHGHSSDLEYVLYKLLTLSSDRLSTITFWVRTLIQVKRTIIIIDIHKRARKTQVEILNVVSSKGSVRIVGVLNRFNSITLTRIDCHAIRRRCNLEPAKRDK